MVDLYKELGYVSGQPGGGVPASSNACVQYDGITICQPLVVSHMQADGKRHLECTCRDYTTSDMDLGGTEVGFSSLLPAESYTKERKKKTPHRGVGLQARHGALGSPRGTGCT